MHLWASITRTSSKSLICGMSLAYFWCSGFTTGLFFVISPLLLIRNTRLRASSTGIPSCSICRTHISAMPVAAYNKEHPSHPQRNQVSTQYDSCPNSSMNWTFNSNQINLLQSNAETYCSGTQKQEYLFTHLLLQNVTTWYQSSNHYRSSSCKLSKQIYNVTQRANKQRIN